MHLMRETTGIVKEPRDIRYLRDPQGTIYPNGIGKTNIPIPIHMFSSFAPPIPTAHPGAYPGASQALSQNSFYGFFDFCFIN